MNKGIREQEPLIDQPLVSICIPIYNAEKTVKQTLESILKQTYRNIEILVVDNASEDETIALVQQFNDSRLTIHRNDRNIGGEQNWSRAISMSRGEYVAVYHSDDLYDPCIVEKQIEAFRRDSSIEAVFTLATRINANGEVIGRMRLPRPLRGKTTFHSREVFMAVLEYMNFFVCPSCMVRGDLYRRLIPFDVNRFGVASDLDMWLRILQSGPICILNEYLMSYRMSASQGSSTTLFLRTSPADTFTVLDSHLAAQSSHADVPRSSLQRYEFLRAIDGARCGVNHLIKRQPREAKEALQGVLSSDAVKGAIRSLFFLGKAKEFGYWSFGVFLLGLSHLGLARYLRRSLYWFLYVWMRRRYT